uniref:BHLH domain-containing protein n=1 Tax=Nelumbo nucifera TaxID=4432 RepID=A0A822ZLW2_NELNU|nr:TPA_asm: hypothetical protein HUJ06_000968 [Nelumbo nucifera]
MLSLSPQFSILGWPSEADTSPEQKSWMSDNPFVNCNFREKQASESFFLFTSSRPEAECNEFKSCGTTSRDPAMVKKLNHNASERDRRKKMNSLYSSLRSLLPETDQTTKQSIPATVSRVLKYIPELQKRVERLKQRKQEILSSITRHRDHNHQEKRRKATVQTSSPTVSASRAGDGEIVIQICAVKVKKSPLSEVLLHLEQEGLQVLNASAFATFGETAFYNLHLQVRESQGVECEVLSQKLMSMYHSREE